MKFRKFLCYVLIFAIMMSLGVTAFAALSTLAACSHSTLGAQYSDAEHPHKYYRTCKNCNVKVYVGGNATKSTEMVHGVAEHALNAELTATLL